jgi:hypothetical protein
MLSANVLAPLPPIARPPQFPLLVPHGFGLKMPPSNPPGMMPIGSGPVPFWEKAFAQIASWTMFTALAPNARAKVVSATSVTRDPHLVGSAVVRGLEEHLVGAVRHRAGVARSIVTVWPCIVGQFCRVNAAAMAMRSVSVSSSHRPGN